MALTEDLLAPSIPRWRVDARDLGAALGEPSGSGRVAGGDSAHDTESDAASDTVLVVVLADADLHPGRENPAASRLGTLLAPVGLDADAVVATHEPTATAGAVTTIPLRPGSARVRRVLLVGSGEGSLADLRAAGAAAGRATRGRGRVLTDLSGLTAGAGDAAAGRPGAVAGTEAALAAYVEAAVLAGWAAPRWSADGPVAGAAPAREVRVLTGPSTVSASASISFSETVARAVARARAQLVARGLARTPSNIKTPAWLAARARTAARRGGLDVRVWTEKELRAEGFGGLLAVGAGSATPPRLVRLDHAGQTGAPHVVLVGKGITFDTGGLCLKPAEAMVPMKTDMSGAGIVLAVLAACRGLGVRAHVTGLLACAENAIGAAAYRPGDVVTQHGGTRVEIGNTDAEGRIVLADAIAYAVGLAPDAIVDIATLTGAARVALARAMAPVFASDDGLRDALVAAGGTTGETLWPLPMPTDYRRLIDSDVADLAHISAGGAGAIVAAMFLREFAGEIPWAHLDIAGPGRSDVDSGIHAKGGTGFGTRLLLRWLEGV